ncbi:MULTISPECIES: DUF6651 domain-containing protein [Acinetobacter]|jgi:hypothetical protein|uniref:DUF6651 domain-containing protein n=1 Tax=Acinetobacter bereziniae NIPH 3 TaxID=1217651 RepID=N8YN22_ACIBZ|nr:DUF6651 domain-containing protein [Acinetobacter bereziniae]ENV20963.1 hypothetical protein F963_03094 [Acinetobacter bereziniae NIPH 3]MCU4434735.1 hypothetical protein [Acinetobacter bereziniae]MDR6541612.1 hypothetical protein [Acinetobacter bereziniae]
MKLKTIQIENKTYAEVNEEGKPLYLHEDGTEIAFDAPHAIAKINELGSEAKNHRIAKEQAEASLKTFEGLDAEKARNALNTIKNFDDKKLIDAGEAERVRTEAIDSVKQTYETQLGQITSERDAFQQQLHNELIGGGFARSKFIQEKVAVPVDMVQAMFGQNFKVEDGKPIAYDSKGQKIYSRTNHGDEAAFDEALEILIGGYQHKDSILKGSQAGGGGFSGQGGQGGGKAMSRQSFEQLAPPEKQAFMKDGGQITEN